MDLNPGMADCARVGGFVARRDRCEEAHSDPGDRGATALLPVEVEMCLIERGADEYVISANEKSHSNPSTVATRPADRTGPGRTRRVEFEYRRGGTMAYFAAYDGLLRRLRRSTAPT